MYTNRYGIITLRSIEPSVACSSCVFIIIVPWVRLGQQQYFRYTRRGRPASYLFKAGCRRKDARPHGRRTERWRTRSVEKVVSERPVTRSPPASTAAVYRPVYTRTASRFFIRHRRLTSPRSCGV